VSRDDHKNRACPAFAELVPLLDAGRSDSENAAIQAHVSFCARCAFALELLKELMREEVTSEEKAMLDSIGQRKRAKKFRSLAKNLL
jgi:hypothetical protein